MPLSPIPPDPEPTKRQYSRYLRADMPEPMRTGWAKFVWRYERQKTHPNEFLVAFAGPNLNYGAEWPLIKERVLVAAGYQCAGCGRKAKDVHHRDYRPRVMSGEDISPLVALCRRCHRKIDKLKGNDSWNAAEALLAELVAQHRVQRRKSRTLSRPAFQTD